MQYSKRYTLDKIPTCFSLSTLVILLAIQSQIFAQNFTLPQGEYMDTTRIIHPDCSPPYVFYYFEVKVKYPLGSEELLNSAVSFMQTRPGAPTSSGYLTFKFLVDCKGTLSRVRVMQSDEDYKAIRFPRPFVNDLYSYVRQLDKWPVNQEVDGFKNANFIAFITFKIKNGQIVNIIP